MVHFRLLLAATFVLALAACAPAKPISSSALPPPASAQDTAPSASAAPDAGSNSGGTYPYGSATAVQTGNAAAAQDSGTVVGPSGAIWLKSGTANERYRSDADDCYGYAQAQINHDARIESDADAAFGDRARNTASVALQQQMSQFAREKRLPRLFGQCMEAKGYTRG
jgi:hypothetical protein